MTINNREVLFDVFNKLGELARYHTGAGKEAATVHDFAKADYHMNTADHYIAVRWDILRLLEDGS